MKQKLSPASDVFLAQEAVRAVFTGDVAIVRARVEAASGDIALLSKDVPLTPPEDIGIGTFDTVGLKGMHDKGEALNAAMYWAAFSGHDGIVDYFIARGDYCQKTLDAALFGAVCAGDIAMVRKLVDAGADPMADDGAVLERSAMRKDAAIADFLTATANAHARALGLHLQRGNFDKALSMLDRKIDVTEGIRAIANKLTDRTALVTDADRDRYLDFFETLMAYAKASGADMNALVTRTVETGIDHWASPLFERLIGHEDFLAHPDRKKLLDAIAERTALSSNPHYDTGYTDYETFCPLLADAGANPDILLRAALQAGNTAICSTSLGKGGDPRRGRPPILEQLREKGKDSPIYQTVFKIAEVMAQHKTEEDTRILGDFCAEHATMGGVLRARDPKTGRTGFMIAAQTGYLGEMLDKLASHGGFLDPADADAQDNRGTTLARLAEERAEGHLLLQRKLFRDRASFLDFHSRLSPELQQETAGCHYAVLAAFDSLEGRSALTRRMLHSNKRWKL